MRASRRSLARDINEYAAELAEEVRRQRPVDISVGVRC
jgi:hypothetical protein